MPDNDLSQRFARIRQCFPGTTAGPYLDVSARCLLYSRARKAFDAYLDQNGDGTLDKKAMFAGVERTLMPRRAKAARNSKLARHEWNASVTSSAE